jgi:hypothetical protein
MDEEVITPSRMQYVIMAINESLDGKNSLGSSRVRVKTVQKNVDRAIRILDKVNRSSPLRPNLVNAQSQILRASISTGDERAAALSAAQQALIATREIFQQAEVKPQSVQRRIVI